jgi:hypothetical protein
VEKHVRSVRGLFVETDNSVAERMRLRRWAFIREHFPELEHMKILDLGGTASWWRRAPVMPEHVTTVNLRKPEGVDMPGLTSIVGDACHADELLSGQMFDLVLSNSLIEHVGGHSQRVRLAEVIRALAPRYLVQTPYRYFPVEPHWVFPGMQFMPTRLQGYIAPRWPLGHTRGWTADKALSEVMFTELIGIPEMKAYFPDAKLYWERFCGLRKSMTVIR